MSEVVELHDADPAWPAAFERERKLILPCFAELPLLVEHMGSTSIPGLPAKPIIDIIVLVADLEVARGVIPALEAAGFEYRADYADKTKIFLMKRADSDGSRTHHLHIHEHADEVRRHLLFRDALRADDHLRDAYRDLKQELALRYRDDRIAYSRHKTAFIDRLVLGMGGPARRVAWDP
ncbi:GrpB family protein [Devosia sp.]|uniref:GrpB family protein n=1 Tax=Devosia sp. TaxID=1871048 RepID=UPI002FC8E503